MRNIAAALSIASVVATGSCFSTPAHAGADATQAASEPSPEAVEAFYRGRELFDAGRYEEALEAFERADRLHPSADLQFNIGQCHMRLGDWQSAITGFEVYLHLKPDAHDRGHVESLIAEARENLKDDGRADGSVTATELTVAELDPDVEHPRANAGSRHAAATPSDPSPPSPTPPAPRAGTLDDRADTDPRPGVLLGTGIALVGVGVATLGGGVALSVLLDNRNDAIRRINEGNPEEVSFGEAAELEQQANRFANGQYVAYATGGALTITGIVLIAVGAKRQTSNDSELSLVPVRMTGGGGLRLEGRF